MKKIWIILPMLVLTTLLLSACSKKTNVDNLEVQQNLEDQMKDLESQKTKLSFPSWLKDLNIDEPKGLQLNKDSSYITTEKVEGFNSVHFSYYGDYDTAMAEAKRIANKAGIALSEEFAMAQEMVENMGIKNANMQELIGDLKGVLYTNYTLLEKPNEKYMISIAVDEYGTLEIDVVDREQMEKVAKDHTKYNTK